MLQTNISKIKIEFFTQEHLDAKETYNTTNQANYWLSTIDATDFIERMPYFFFSTSSSNGNTNVNFKGLNCCPKF